VRASRAGTMAMACVTVVLFVIGVWQTGTGAWIYVKARLAQVLLQQAWASTLNGNTPARPWPWADTWPVARLVVPSQHIDQIVLEGAYGRTLAFGPGHVESSARFERPETIILTGHRDTHFRFLERLQPGDVVALQDRQGQWIHFTVQDRQVVDSQIASIYIDAEDTQLVLVTCYPFDAITTGGPLRYVVTGQRIH
jgi:sortase A